MFTVRILSISDAEDFRSIRLEGLERYPDAFGASFSVEAAQSLDFFAHRLQQNTVFGGFDETGLLGIACFRAFQQEKARHKGVLYGMYVRNRAQGTGLVSALVQAILSHARLEVELVQLTVVNSNHKALRLYEKCGFKAYGVEPKAIKIAGAYLDETLMYVSLK